MAKPKKQPDAIANTPTPEAVEPPVHVSIPMTIQPVILPKGRRKYAK